MDLFSAAFDLPGPGDKTLTNSLASLAGSLALRRWWALDIDGPRLPAARVTRSLPLDSLKANDDACALPGPSRSGVLTTNREIRLVCKANELCQLIRTWFGWGPVVGRRQGLIFSAKIDGC